MDLTLAVYIHCEKEHKDREQRDLYCHSQLKQCKENIDRVLSRQDLSAAMGNTCGTSVSPRVAPYSSPVHVTGPETLGDIVTRITNIGTNELEGHTSRMKRLRQTFEESAHWPSTVDNSELVKEIAQQFIFGLDEFGVSLEGIRDLIEQVCDSEGRESP